MSLKLVRSMSLVPHCCAICGGTPRDDDGNQEPSVLAGGVDIDWGGALYICKSCGQVIAELFGGLSLVHANGLRGRVEYLEERERELEEALEVANERIARMIDGAKARKEAKKAREVVASAHE